MQNESLMAPLSFCKPTGQQLFSPLTSSKFPTAQSISASIKFFRWPAPSIPTLRSRFCCVSAPANRLRRSSVSANSDDQASLSPSPTSRIFIKGLPRSTSEGRLLKIFSFFGEVTRVKIITSKPSRDSLGLAYVWFSRQEDAELAVKEMDGKFIDGRFIKVMMAKPEAPTSQRRTTPYKF